MPQDETVTIEVRELLDILESVRTLSYGGERVDQLSHALQCARHALTAGADAAHPWRDDAVALRRWDEAVKDPDAVTPALDDLAPIIATVVLR